MLSKQSFSDIEQSSEDNPLNDDGVDADGLCLAFSASCLCIITYFQNFLLQFGISNWAIFHIFNFLLKGNCGFICHSFLQLFFLFVQYPILATLRCSLQLPSQLPQQFNNLEQKTSRNQGVTMRPYFYFLFKSTSVSEFLKNWNHQKMSFPEMHRSLFFLFVQIAFSKFRIPVETLHHTICPRKK